MVERPEYIVCPECESKMKIDYSSKQAETDGIFNIHLRAPARFFSKGKTRHKYFWVSICNNCKKILGVSQEE